MRDLETAGHQLFTAVNQVASVSDSTTHQAKNVLQSLEEISSSTEHLAYEAERGNHQLADINSKVEQIISYTVDAAESLDSCLEQSDQGLIVVDSLKKQSIATEQITLNVGQKIYSLESHMRQIHDLLTNIQDVAEQTSLLSLNASIEAARAGEHGRGFHVVAEEIRKLSTNSKNASEQIGGLLNNISQDVDHTSRHMRNAENSLREQLAHVDNTIHSFYRIRDQIQTVAGNIQKVNDTMDSLANGKESLLITIESVSSMSQTAASVEMIRSNFTSQLEAIQQLNDSCVAMQETSNLLTTNNQ